MKYSHGIQPAFVETFKAVACARRALSRCIQHLKVKMKEIVEAVLPLDFGNALIANLFGLTLHNLIFR